MTYIKSFHIEGLAGRREPVEHTLDRYTNIFWGLNGSGKTTVLQILDAAMRNDTRSLETMPFRHAVVVFHSEVIERDIERVFVKGDRPPEMKDQQLSFELTREVAIGSDWAVDDDGEDEDDPGWTTTILGEPLDPVFEGQEEARALQSYARRFLPISRVVTVGRSGAPRANAYDFVRRVNEVWRRYSASSLAEIESVQRQGMAAVLAILFGGIPNRQNLPDLPDGQTKPIDAKDAYQLVSSFLNSQRLVLPLGMSNFVRRYEESEENRQVVARIQSTNAWVDEIRAPEREFQAIIEEMYIGNKHIEFEFGPRVARGVSVRLGPEKIPLTSLSSGEKQLLQILLETLAASSSTVLIDEPELSLHPDWQKRLVGSMRRVNSSAQFIMATHSPDLMLHVPTECVFEL